MHLLSIGSESTDCQTFNDGFIWGIYFRLQVNKTAFNEQCLKKKKKTLSHILLGSGMVLFDHISMQSQQSRF